MNKEKQKGKEKREKKILADVAEASSQKAERAELKVNDGGVSMYV